MGRSPFLPEPSTLQQLPRTAREYYDSLFRGSPYDYEDTGQKDQIGGRVYARSLNGKPLGYVAVLPYNDYARRVKEAAKRSRSMGVSRLYRPMDPETGLDWGDTRENPKRRGSDKQHRARLAQLRQWVRSMDGDEVEHAATSSERVYLFNSRASAKTAEVALRASGWRVYRDEDLLRVTLPSSVEL